MNTTEELNGDPQDSECVKSQLPYKWPYWTCVTGTWSGSLGVLFIPADWLVKFFRLSGLVDIIYLTVYTNVLFICLGTWSDNPITPPFLINNHWPITGKPYDICLPWLINPLWKPSPGTTRTLSFFRWPNFLGRPPDQNSTLQELGDL